MLSAQERAHVAQVWDLIAGHEAAFGAELLLRWVEAGFPGSQGGGHRGWGPESEGRARLGFRVSGSCRRRKDPARPPSLTDRLHQALHGLSQHQDLLQAPGRLPRRGSAADPRTTRARGGGRGRAAHRPPARRPEPARRPARASATRGPRQLPCEPAPAAVEWAPRGWVKGESGCRRPPLTRPSSHSC